MDSRGSSTRHFRDDHGQIVGLVSDDTGVEGDASGRVVRRVREDCGITNYTRDVAGRATERRPPRGPVTRWEHNARVIAAIKDKAIIDKILTHLENKASSAKPAPLPQVRAPLVADLFS